MLMEPEFRPVLPVERRTLIFGDPAYDRRLSSSTSVRSERIATQVFPDLPSAKTLVPWVLALDRKEYDPGASIHFAVGPVNQETGTFPANGTLQVGDPLTTAWTAKVKFKVRRFDPGASEPPKPELLTLDFDTAAGVSILPAQAYSIPLSAMKSVAGERLAGAGLRPGDTLVLEVTLEEGGKETSLTVEGLIVAEPVMAPPSSVYSLVDVEGKEEDWRATTTLHASAPLPQMLEFPDLRRDLARGHVRRRGLFFWHHGLFLAEVPGKRFSTLVKIDRSGGGQVPNVISDFMDSTPR